ncbi:hypothetical protein FHS42_004271 [Streptomyces zagrosensis]|uniref:Uncharacterized protein n=1 Tax=Streptomyces zagrosensis TaxID=1042984 RepID=A0A7W9QDV2_9ACTN|nr:hypothetical protein [Streptomyces zagrosensis]
MPTGRRQPGRESAASAPSPRNPTGCRFHGHHSASSARIAPVCWPSACAAPIRMRQQRMGGELGEAGRQTDRQTDRI